ncbi:DUF1295 domain-containing protein [Caulobacter sp. CCUG 60055]|uniref:DUF1295 domain-containing protein n=1 Tax=Caulobacter sp. CCUG 60055 TaxID=2100090 RepID=UPI001FA708B3|nr:DUF1295 domain-containing protein [Caulobacter sp. CCUG 60055]
MVAPYRGHDPSPTSPLREPICAIDSDLPAGASMILAALIALGLMTLVMSLAWACVLRTGNGGWTDVFWTFGTGLCGVLAALAPWSGAPRARQALVAMLVALWALRLGTYIAVRVARGVEDVRYRTLKAQWGERFKPRLLALALVQAPASAALCLSIAAAATSPGEGLRATDVLGAAILLIAIGGEALADEQMRRFKAGEHAPGAVMDRGLWAWSRHPNYFFEWLGWLAYPVIALDLSGGWNAGWLSLLAPAVMALVLMRVTGVPPLEQAMLAAKGEAYARYQARVSPFFPRPPRKGSPR